MNFFEYILSPFIFIIEQLFTFSYDITGNYGIAILLLSFGISILLLPIFIYIEKAKKKDDIVKNKMKPLIDEIKRVYKGQERFYYIKTINRQHNYNSLKALIPILSLLIQIPFFIAAYQFLEGFEPLKNVSFLFIPDLSKPDGLFGIVNALPIIMTIVNILTAYYYTRNGNKTEFTQMMVLAVVFLILLFNLPAGLVLYWTMNNVFSFLRLFITNPEVFRKKEVNKEKPKLFSSNYKIILPQLKKIFTVLAIGLSAFQINWAFKYSFDDIIIRLLAALALSLIITLVVGLLIPLYIRQKAIISEIKIKPIVYFSLLFLAVYFYLASTFYFTGINTNLSIIAGIILIPVQFLGFVYFNRNKNIIKYFALLSILLKVLFAAQLLNLYTIISQKDIAFSLLNLEFNISLEGSYISFVSAGILFSLVIAYFIIKSISDKFISSTENWKLYLLSIIYVLGLVLFWNPLIVFSSYPENYTFTGLDIIANNFSIFIIMLVFLSVLYRIIPKRVKVYWLILTITITILSFIHNTILPIDLGSLQESKYLNQGNLSQPIFMYFIEAVCILILLWLINLLREKNKFKYLTIAIALLNIILISESIVSSIESNSLFNRSKIVTNPKNSISFSKTEENVIFFISDMFQGPYMERIISENPDLRKGLTGFEWFPNTVSVSPITCTSVPPILGGYDYTIDKLNEDSSHTLYEKTTQISENFVSKIKSKGFNFTSSDIIYSKIDKTKFDSYLPRWDEDWDKWNANLNIGKSVEQGYTLLWKNAFLYSLPLFLKPTIYQEGKWMQNKKPTIENSNTAKRYNFLRLLPYISNTMSKKPNFIYIHSMASHHPWDIVDDQGIIHSDVSPYDNNKWVIETFVKWIEWMKKNNVYNNTKIVFMSDHGIHWQHVKGKIKSSLPLKNYKDKVTTNEMYLFNAMYPLLMVKEPNNNNKFAVNNKLSCNADASYIAFNEYIDRIYKNEKIPVAISPWIRKIGEQKKLKIIKQFEVNQSAFDLKYWEIIE